MVRLVTVILKKCWICGKKNVKIRMAPNHITPRYCSQKCKDKRYRRNKRVFMHHRKVQREYRQRKKTGEPKKVPMTLAEWAMKE